MVTQFSIFRPVIHQVLVSERVGDSLFLFYNALSFHRLNQRAWSSQLCVRKGTCVPGCMDKNLIRLDMDRLLLSFVTLKSSMQRLEGPKFSSAVGSQADIQLWQSFQIEKQ